MPDATANTTAIKPAPSFTAAEYSAALRRVGLSYSRQAVTKALDPSRASGIKIPSGGRETPTWQIADLPERYQKPLTEGAGRLGYRDPAAMIRDGAKRGLAKLSDFSAEEIATADTLRRALLPSLRRQHDRTLTRNRLIQQGIEDYSRVLGRAVSPKFWWKTFRRIVDNDASAEAWERIELYLTPRLGSKPRPAASKANQTEERFSSTTAYLEGTANPAALSPTEWRGLWRTIFDEVKEQVGGNVSERTVDSRMREFLAGQKPFAGKSDDAIYKAYVRAKAEYESGPARGTVEDLRRYNTGNHDGYELPEADRDLLIGESVDSHEGRVAPAWEKLLLNQSFSAATQERYFGKSKKPSHVPASIMDSVRAEIEILCILHQGPRAFNLAKGHIRRTKDGIPSLCCMMADDVTLPVYFYIRDDRGAVRVVRGQCLIFICFRSHKILGWSLQPDRNYSSITIRSMLNRIFYEYQVASVLYFELGIWATSKLLKGTKAPPFSNAEVSEGLKALGVRFIHARRPQAKGEVERAIGILQDMMPGERGWCGRDEKRDAPESLRRQMAEVLRKENPVPPEAYFYSYGEWNARIGEIIAQYNARPQKSSRHLKGLSPNEACARFIDTEPPLQMDAMVRLLLSRDAEYVLRLSLDGYVRKVGMREFVYRGNNSSALVGQPVWAFFDPENPEYCVLTDKDRSPESVCILELNEEPGALDEVLNPDSEALDQEQSRIEGQASHWKARYNVVKRSFALPERPIILDKKTAVLHHRANEQLAAAKAQKKVRTKQERNARVVQRDTGLKVAGDGGFTDDEARVLSDFFGESAEADGRQKSR